MLVKIELLFNIVGLGLLTEIDLTAFSTIHNKSAFLHIEIDVNLLTFIVIKDDSGLGRLCRHHVHLQFKGILLVGRDICNILFVRDEQVGQTIAILSQQADFRCNIGRHIYFSILPCKEFELTWESIGTTILTDWGDIGILPVAHPRDTQHTIFNAGEGHCCIMILAIVKKLGNRGLTVADKVISIKVTYKVLCSTTTEETARINVHNHYPFLLICIAIDRKFEEVGAFKLVRLCTIAFTESTYISPILQIG